MDSSPESKLQPHEYLIHKGGIESGPFTMVRLREMWANGELDGSTKFKRLDLGYWVDADDLTSELEFSPPDESEDVVEEKIVAPAPKTPPAPQVVADPPAIASAPAFAHHLMPTPAPSQPYKKPILYWILGVIAIFAFISGLGILLMAMEMKSGAGNQAAVMASFPVLIFAIVTAGFVQLVDYLGRTAHFTQQSAELLQRELPALRTALESQRKH